MAPFEAPPPTRRATSHRRPSSAMAPSSSSSTVAMAFSAISAKRSSSPPRRRPPNKHRSTNQYAYDDDDDDLELPVVSSKPLSSADSIAKFHRVRIVGVSDDVDVHTRRPQSSEAKPAARKRSGSTSSTASSASTLSARSSIASSSSSSSSYSSGGPNPFTAKTRARAHQRPKYHAAASAKQIVRHNRLSSLVLHSVTPREGVPSSSSSSTSSSSSGSTSYTEYNVVVENVRTSQIWQVARRFSSFVQFRKELTALFATPHCHHCTAMHAKLDALHDDFPAKRLWGSNSKKTTAQRAQKLQQYLHGLLALAAKSHTKQCRLIASSFAMHLRGFLTVESTGFHGIPGDDLGHSVPSLLQELSRANTGAVVATASTASKRLPLATILENVPSQSIRASPWDADSIALLEKDEEAETEDEEDASPSSDNQRDA